MDSLFKVVLSGMYAKLPQHYSAELASMVKMFLQVESTRRPTCEDILAHEFVQHRMASKNFEPVYTDAMHHALKDELLQTIHCPRNLSQLSHMLPRSKYDSSHVQ